MSRADRQFDAFVTTNLDGLVRTAYLIVWDEHEAEDLVQECLFRVARRWTRISRMQHPLAYARRVLVNVALDDAKRRSRRGAELDGATGAIDAMVRGPAAETPAIDRLDTRAELVSALAALGPRQRAVLVLRYFLDLTEADTAQALGCSVGTVKSSSAKALARLRQSLDTDQPLREAPEP